jgi:excisionase family DNA binding protein
MMGTRKRPKSPPPPRPPVVVVPPPRAIATDAPPRLRPGRYLSLKEAGAILQVSARVVRRLTLHGGLRAVRVGRGFRIHEDWLYRFMEDRAKTDGVHP